MAGSVRGGGEARIKQILQGISHPPRSAYPPANHTKPIAWALPTNQTQNFRRPLLPAIFVGKAHATICAIKAKGRLKILFIRPLGKLDCRTQHCELSDFRWVSNQSKHGVSCAPPRITNKPIAWNPSTKMIKKGRLKIQTPGFQTTFHIFSPMPGRLRRTCGLFVAVVHKQILRREPAYPIFRIFIDYPRIVFFIAVQFAA